MISVSRSFLSERICYHLFTRTSPVVTYTTEAFICIPGQRVNRSQDSWSHNWFIAVTGSQHTTVMPRWSVMISDWPNRIGRMPRVPKCNLMHFKGYCLNRSYHTYVLNIHTTNTCVQETYKIYKLVNVHYIFYPPSCAKTINKVGLSISVVQYLIRCGCITTPNIILQIHMWLNLRKWVLYTHPILWHCRGITSFINKLLSRTFPSYKCNDRTVLLPNLKAVGQTQAELHSLKS